MRVFICGIDGYLGWALMCHLSERGHIVSGMDSGLRRELVELAGGCSAIPIESLNVRADVAAERWGKTGEDPYPPVVFQLGNRSGSTLDAAGLRRALETFRPDCVVYLAQMPSAPWSMREPVETMENNILGYMNLLMAVRDLCPHAHIVKLGTMGEYGTPDCPIPEGFFPAESAWNRPEWDPDTKKYKWKTWGSLNGLMFPRKAGSWYHWSKVHDTMNTWFACQTYGLRATDIMQGVVYGTHIDAMGEDPRLRTRFDFDECFGTAINRFCAQAVIGHPLTVYGAGKQTRGFLPLHDAMQCLTIAIEKPVGPGEYRVWNQFAEPYSILDLAERVQDAAVKVLGCTCPIEHVPNPRHEMAEHRYDVCTDTLAELGYEPDLDIDSTIAQMLEDLHPHTDRIESHRSAIEPRTQWSVTRETAEAAD